MSRPRSRSRDELVASAMILFWKQGYGATSMEDLVAASGVGRGGIYADFGGKEALFLACLEAYTERFADPAIGLLAAGDDGLDAIGAYFDHFIALHEQRGMPGPGCFIANTMTELAPRNDAALRIVKAHSARLKSAFRDALMRAGGESGARLAPAELDGLAEFLVTSSQGLWSYGKSIDDVRVLKSFRDRLLDLLRARFCMGGAGPA